MTDTRGNTKNFTKEEREAMRARAKEAKASQEAEDLRKDMMAKIAELPPADRSIAKKLDEIVAANAPALQAKTYYGMPAWALDGAVLVFFQPASKFSTRYGTVGFNDNAKLDDGELWPTSFGITELTPAVEKKLAALIKKAVKQ